MPRKKPEQPKPEEEFWITTEDGERIQKAKKRIRPGYAYFCWRSGRDSNPRPPA